MTEETLATLEARLIPAPYGKEAREVFEKAKPHLITISAKHSGLDCEYLLYLIREQTIVATKFRNEEALQLRQAWVAVCNAWDIFQSLAFKTPTFIQAQQQWNEIQRELRAEEKEIDRKSLGDGGPIVIQAPRRSREKPINYPHFPKEFKEYERKFNLPSPKEVLVERKGGRPSSWWSDVIACAMRDHFVEKTGKPQFPTISKLLKCTPPIRFRGTKPPYNPPLSYSPEHIRQRLDRWQREEKPTAQRAPDLLLAAATVWQLYQEWRANNRKGPCPSFVLPSLEQIR